VAVNAGKLTALASRMFGRGGGTALPGLVAERVVPSITHDLAKQLPRGTTVVSGTNGKTTTSRLLADMLARAGFSPVRNQSGSNLMRGIATSLVAHAGLRGDLTAAGDAVGLFEVDEAALPSVLRSLHPSTVLLLNLFRDQLDRYGEVATIARLWSGGLTELSEDASIVANADDPLVAQTAIAANRPTVFFGIASAAMSSARLDHAADIKSCPQCGGIIGYQAVFLGHLGHYACSRCGFRRPIPRVEASDVRLRGVAGSSFNLILDGQSAPVALPLPGMYNVYNATAAAAAAARHGLTLSTMASSLSQATAAFGRMERVAIDGRDVYIALAKNPAGFNEIMRTAEEDGAGLHLLVLLNDNTADGLDVSWIWDADVEMLAGAIDSAVFSGIRAADMALRFKYAGALAGEDVVWAIEESSDKAFSRALEWTPVGHRLFIIPTYTALLDIRDVLTRRGHVRPYWEE
jgi:UDP-N-acetylmuramyl tripeptide synthase